jgi:VWFA-related protein
MFSSRYCAALASLVLAVSVNLLHAQASPGAPPADQPTYTLKANTRIVLTDVTVTDSAGRPVHGLPQSAFHILDDKQTQTIVSFEEHAGVAPAAAPLVGARAGVYSNDYLQHLPPVLNIILLDITNLEMTDQMYLNYELTKFLNNVPNSQPLAIYLRSGERILLLQDFTSDPALLLAALHKAIPRFPPTGREYLTDLQTMHQLATYLSQLPGRKNVMWFSGGSTYFLRPDSIYANNVPWRTLYDELDQGRIAIYPVDARGLTVVSDIRMDSQHSVMAQVAQATGGRAFYNNNGLIEDANQVLNSDVSFYTLTYSPSKIKFDNKWHKVRIDVEGGPYQLSYRTGYFADGSLGSGQQPAKSRTALKANGEKVDVSPELRSIPIIFQATVLPASDPAVAALPKASAVIAAEPLKKGEIPFSIRYTMPVSALTVQDVDGEKRVSVGVGTMAFNSNGRPVVRKGERLNMSLNPQFLSEHPNGYLSIDQPVALQKGDEYLYLAVWDLTSGRLGTLQIALSVPKPPKEDQLKPPTSPSK